MNPIIESILSRRSIRKFYDKPVDNELINIILKAGFNAPSAGNQQPWHFVIINDRKILDEIADFHPYAKMARQTPQAFLVCGEPALEKHPGYWPVDCSAATENMLLAIHALGLGGVWVGVYPREERMKEITRICNLPDHIKPFALIPFGYPAEEKPPANRFIPDRIKYNRW
ncbi:MAG: nitroreductase family protein [Calditrichia bacterium]